VRLYPHCHPSTLLACKPYTDAVACLPNGKVMLLPYNSVNYQTQTVRVDLHALMVRSGQVGRNVGLPGTGGAALLPLVGAVMLIGGRLILRRLPH